MAHNDHSTNPDTIRGLAELGKQFMVPSITFGDCWEVSANHGETQYIPAEIIGTRIAAAALFADYVSGTIDTDEHGEPIAELRCNVYLAQLSAPGYMDQTDLALFETLAQAEDYLVETYADGL